MSKSQTWSQQHPRLMSQPDKAQDLAELLPALAHCMSFSWGSSPARDAEWSFMGPQGVQTAFLPHKLSPLGITKMPALGAIGSTLEVHGCCCQGVSVTSASMNC